ncbi:MAG: DUF885 domain-containing protein [Chloroflexota bacterium]
MTDAAFQPSLPDPLPLPTTPFGRALDAYLRDVFAANPVFGGYAGYHLVDGAWTDLSEAGRQDRLALLARHRAAIAAIPEADLVDGERVDRPLLLELIDQQTFSDAQLRDEAWDPLVTVSTLGAGLFGLLARDYAPWSHRGAAFLARVRGIPAFLDGALGALTGLPDRPVSLLHLDTALKQLPGIDQLVDAGVAEARGRAEAGSDPELLAPLEAAAATAHEALAGFRHALDTDVRARASGEGRLGPDLYAQKLRHTLGSDLTPDQLLDRAWADHRAVRAEMLRLARELWSAWVPGEPLPAVAAGDEAGERALVRRVLDAIALEHQDPKDLLAWSRQEIARIEAFCREHDVITLADEPLEITWTPVYMRPYGRAFLDAPGPLDRGQQSHFFITPPDDDATPEQIESYMREDNDRGLVLLAIHEGVPGHYLQLARSNHSPSLVRTIFSNGMFAEGWAVYVEQVLLDLGYDADDPALWLSHWKFYLRAVTNAILDVETHARGMTREAAMELMVDQAFQEEDEATAKWLRARITSTQLSTYYVGAVEMYDLETAMRRRAAVAAGADASVVPERTIGPGPGPTPGFVYRAHLESVIAHGTPPIRWVRRILEDAADAASGTSAA